MKEFFTYGVGTGEERVDDDVRVEFVEGESGPKSSSIRLHGTTKSKYGEFSGKRHNVGLFRNISRVD